MNVFASLYKDNDAKRIRNEFFCFIVPFVAIGVGFVSLSLPSCERVFAVVLHQIK